MKYSILQLTIANLKISATQPWVAAIQNSTSSGFVILLEDKKYIITNAHCVSNARDILIKFPYETKQYQASVIRVSHEADLALLYCSDSSFLKKAEPLNFADELPKQGAQIQAHGFPNGNDYSVTKGAVNRYDVSLYAHGKINLLKFTIDALLKPGNSGGPLTIEADIDEDGQKKKQFLVVGVNHQTENNGGFGAAIPLSILKHFLENPNGFPQISMQCQVMDNPVLQKLYGLDESNPKGLLILDVSARSCAKNILQRHDVILEIDKFPLDIKGNVYVQPIDTSVCYSHIVMTRKIGDEIPVKILRDKKVIELTITLTKSIRQCELTPYVFEENLQRYFCRNGLVIIPLTYSYYQHMLEIKQQPSNQVIAELGKMPSKTDSQSKIFVISKVLASSFTQGISLFEGSIITTINGKQIGSMNALISAFLESNVDTHIIETSGGNILALQALTDLENAALLIKYQIPAMWPDFVAAKYNASKKTSSFWSKTPLEDSTVQTLQATEAKGLGDSPR